MALARRLAVVAAALLGVALTVAGLWLVLTLGSQGTATFRATSRQPTVLIGPNVLNRVAEPATVTGSAASGPVFIGVATPQDASQAIGQARHEVAVAARFPARNLQLEGFGGDPLPDVSGYHVWRHSAEGSLTVSQDQGPQAVVVYATQGGPLDVSVSFSRGTWFAQALVCFAAGLLVLLLFGLWSWRHRRSSARVRPVGAQ